MKRTSVLLFLAFVLNVCNAECEINKLGDQARDFNACAKAWVSVKTHESTEADSADAFRTAIESSNVIYVPAGIYHIATPVEIPPGRDILIFGDGENSLIEAKGTAFLQKDAKSVLGNISFRSLKIRGDLKDTVSQMTSANLIELRRGNSLYMENLVVERSRFFGIHATYFNKIDSINVVVRKTARDAMNFSGSQNIRITGGAISESGDDAIAAHFGDYSKELAPFERNIVIDGVDISDSLGIKVLGARNVKIINNNIRLAKGYAIFVGWDWYSKEGFLSQYDLVFSGNTIANWVGLNVFGYPNMDNHAIVLGAYPGGGSSRADLKREPPTDKSRGQVDSECLKISRRALIFGNILRRDPYGSSSYSVAFGGEAFVDEKFNKNPTLPSNYGAEDGVAIDVGGCWQDLNVYDNIFEGVGTVVRGMPDSNFVLNRVRFERNSVVFYKKSPIYLRGKSENNNGYFISRMNYFRFNSKGGGKNEVGNVYLVDGNSKILSDGDIFDGCIDPFLGGRENFLIRNPLFISSKCEKKPFGGAGTRDGDLEKPVLVSPRTEF